MLDTTPFHFLEVDDFDELEKIDDILDKLTLNALMEHQNVDDGKE